MPTIGIQVRGSVLTYLQQKLGLPVGEVHDSDRFFPTDDESGFLCRRVDYTGLCLWVEEEMGFDFPVDDAWTIRNQTVGKMVHLATNVFRERRN